MLRIGHRSYELVRSASHFHVTIGGRRRDSTDQQWMLDAHYVPSAEDPGREDGAWEYLPLAIDLAMNGLNLLKPLAACCGYRLKAIA